MQRRLLPRKLPSIETLGLAAHYTTSRYAGGDYYDVVDAGSGRWGIMVADVAGHGTPAAVGMAMVRTAFHARPDLFAEPAAVLIAINQHFKYYWEETGFVTALYGVYDAGRRSMRIACAGHPRPLLCHGTSRRVEELEIPATIPLVIGPLGDVPVTDIQLNRGDRMLFYTDGIAERSNAAGDFFGPERLAAGLAATDAADAPQLVKRITDAVEVFAGGCEPPDDQTLLLSVVR
jgi:sigma-B regulation protein RsbU (phosphoserine phosphatase)